MCQYSSPETVCRYSWNLTCSIRDLSPSYFIQMLTYFMARSILETGFHMDKSENTGFVWKLLQPETWNLADAVTTYKVNHYKIFQCHRQRFLCPPNWRWGTYCFWCGSRRRPRLRPRRRTRLRSFFPTRYLLNQWMDFIQTCIDTWLGGGKELIRFWWPWPHFQGRQPMKTDQIRFSDAISSEQVNGFWPNLHKSIVGRRLRVY